MGYIAAMMKQATKSPESLVLANIPERQNLRQLQAQLAALRDTIAGLDLEIETVRDTLSEFEAHYHAHLRPEHERVRRIQTWLQHLERWSEVLDQQTRAPAPEALVQRIERLEGRRSRELKQQKGAEKHARKAQTAAQDKPAQAPRAADLQERLKAAYRDLARRFHPDLARTEEERLTNSQTMARINALYRAGDVDRLVAMREQARGGELDAFELSLADQIIQLEERHAWFTAVVHNLQEERNALEQSATCELWRNVEQASANGRDLLEELRAQLQLRIQRLLDDVPHAARSLENAVSRYNRANHHPLAHADKAGALELSFDPYEDKSMVRLALNELGQQQVSPAVRRQARDIEQMAADRPALLRLLLLTYVSELSPLPLSGLERYDDLLLRFGTLCAQDSEAAPVALEQALVESDAWLEYGVRQATATLAHAGLRFRQNSLREAIPVALLALPVRRLFKQVLGVLGEHTACTGCHEQIFAVPLYRTRGLDDLRASVCPRCGTLLNSYWMPRGKDMQAVLNVAFLDFEIVSEFAFTLGRASIAMQLVPQQVETLSVGDVKKRLVQDVFTRHEIEITPSGVQLFQNNKRVRDSTPLHTLEAPRFEVRFAAGAKLSETDALELVRHRIRTRFS